MNKSLSTRPPPAFSSVLAADTSARDVSMTAHRGRRRLPWWRGHPLLVIVTLALLGAAASPGPAVCAQAAGGLDPAFGAADADSQVASVAVQPDGKILLGGRFAKINDTPRNYLARLSADGSLDADFTASADGPVLVVAAQPNGQVLLGGYFTQVSGVACAGVARLNADGSVDPGFAASTDGVVECVALQPDGKILLGGLFTQVNGAMRRNVVRLNADGSLDPGFSADVNPPPDPNVSSAEVLSLAVQPDGRILLGGLFTRVAGAAHGGVVRLYADGSVDAGFKASARSDVLNVVVQPDGKILLGGYFYQVNGAVRPNLARLNADGSLDAGFTTVTSGDVVSIVLQADGKILLGGGFAQVNDVRLNNLARLNADGSVDAGFAASATLRGGVYGEVYSVALQPDGKVVVGGYFTEVNGAARSNVARLLGDAPATGLPVVGVGVDVPTISRGAGQVATLTFTRNGGDLSAALPVSYRVGGTLIGGRDYAALSGTKKIKAGRQSATLQIVPLAGGAKGKVKLSLPPGAGYTVGSRAKVKVNVTD